MEFDGSTSLIEMRVRYSQCNTNMAYQTNTFGDSSMFSGNIRAQLTPGHQLPRTTAEQISVLEANFKQNRNPNDLEITLIAAEAGMLERDVRVSVYQRTSDGGNGNHSVLLPIILIEIKVDQMLPFSYISSLSVPIL